MSDYYIINTLISIQELCATDVVPRKFSSRTSLQTKNKRKP